MGSGENARLAIAMVCAACAGLPGADSREHGPLRQMYALAGAEGPVVGEL
jgi:hypothetical protein